MKIMRERIMFLEKKIFRIEKLMWYVSGVLTIKMGEEVLPFVMAMI